MTTPFPAAGRGAETYSHGHHPSVLRSHGWRTAENSAGYLLPHLRPDQALLDVGTGPGTITADLAGRVARVVGVDNAAPAVEATRQLARSQGLTNLTAQVGDVYALGLPDDTFDVVHAHQVLQHLADPVAALREMRRVCRPGGLIAVRDADYAAMAWSPASPQLTRWLELYRDLARRNGGEPDAGRALKGWALEAGLAEPTCTASTWCFASAEDLAWWSGTWAERLTASSFAASARGHGLADADELAELASGWREWATQPGAWFAVLHGEVLARA
jgi:SAM-dependent methyltransferase